MIAYRNAGNAGSDIDNDARSLVPHDRREQSFRVGTGQRVGIRVADAGGSNFNEDFTFSAVPSSCTVSTSNGFPASYGDSGSSIHSELLFSSYAKATMPGKREAKHRYAQGLATTGSIRASRGVPANVLTARIRR